MFYRKLTMVAKGNFKFPFIFGLLLSINERNLKQSELIHLVEKYWEGSFSQSRDPMQRFFLKNCFRCPLQVNYHCQLFFSLLPPEV